MKKNKDSISEHAPKSKRPLIHRKFAYFLAGLIDAGGYISKKGGLLILFHEKDISVAYYIKKVLNHGDIKKVKGYNAYNFRSMNGVKKITKLTLDKPKLPKRIKGLNCHLTPKIVFTSFPNLKLHWLDEKRNQFTEPNPHGLFKNDWLAGVIQANGSFVIKTLRRLNKIENKIAVQVNQEGNFLLKQIQHALNGYIGSRESCKSYYYSSQSFLNAIKLVHYLDSYQVMGATLTAYWLWRKAFLILQNNKDKEHAGIYKFIRLKKSLTTLDLRRQ
jgi:hypothetical protein